MKKRILLLATVAALMAVMLVTMASAALAEPPTGGGTGCAGGKFNAEHALSDSASPYATRGEPSIAEDPDANGQEHRNQSPPGRGTAEANLSDTTNCDN